jgi:hypothetical protein
MTERGKLHQLLAVEPDLKSAVNKEADRILSLFKDGKVRLIGQVKTYEPIEESGEDFPDEVVPLATTVEFELDRLKETYGKWLDAVMQKEATNQIANAHLDVGGFIHFLPATALLNLETKLGEIRKLYATIPTLDPTKVWEWNDDKEVYEAAPEVRYRTKKVMRSHVAYDATPEHPAQVETYSEDMRIGVATTVVQSGAIPLKRKRQYMERIDELIRLVKSARQVANSEEVTDVQVAQHLFDYIHAD